MQSIGSALAGADTAKAEAKRAFWDGAVRASEEEFSRQRPWKVRVCVMVFSEVELVGNLASVDRAAEQLAAEAKVIMHTAPAAMRKFVQVRKNRHDPKSELVWAEVAKAPVDAMDHESPWAWQVKRP